MYCIRPPPSKVGAYFIKIINCYPHLYYHPYPYSKCGGRAHQITCIFLRHIVANLMSQKLIINDGTKKIK